MKADDIGESIVEGFGHGRENCLKVLRMEKRGEGQAGLERARHLLMGELGNCLSPSKLKNRSSRGAVPGRISPSSSISARNAAAIAGDE